MNIKIVITVLGFAIAALTMALPVVAQDQSNRTDAAQQQRDQETKERIYGTKHPWENTLPYGTQFTPPASGAGSTPETDTTGAATKSEKAKAPVKAKKTAVKKTATKKRVAAAKKVTTTKSSTSTTTTKQH